MLVISKKNYRPRFAKRDELELEQAFRQVTKSVNGEEDIDFDNWNSSDSETMVFSSQEVQSRSATSAAPKANTQPKKAAAPVESDRIRRDKKIAIIAVSVVAAVLVICVTIGVWFYLSSTADNGLILDNVYAAGINLGGMTPEEATITLHNATDHAFGNESIVIQLPDATLELSPQDTGAKLDVDRLVADAYQYGREGSRRDRMAAMALASVSSHKIDILPYMTLDTGYIKKAIDRLLDEKGSVLTQPDVSIIGKRPTATVPEGFYPIDEEAEEPADPTLEVHETMTITVGTPSRTFDAADVFRQVMDIYNRNDFQPIVVEYTIEEPEAVDLDALVAQYCTAPVDAQVNTDDYSVIQEIWGYGFDAAAAAEALNAAKEGESITLDLKYQRPAVIKPELEATMFQDVLAAADTWYYYHPDRTTNLDLACQAINNYIVKPGEIFSFNDTLGERTEEKGYRPAGAYVNGETVDQIGGGICQVASTLYFCTLYADLEIVERYEHMYSADYVPLGMDATVNWGTLDFRFRNNTNYPIRIEAEIDDGLVKMSLIGTDDKDYYVEMEFIVREEIQWETVDKEMEADNEKGYVDGQVIQKPYMGYVVDTFRYKYHKETGERIARLYEVRSEYDKRDEWICKIISPTEPSAPPVEAEPTLPPSDITPAD